jgi:hypothetical protein
MNLGSMQTKGTSKWTAMIAASGLGGIGQRKGDHRKPSTKFSTLVVRDSLWYNAVGQGNSPSTCIPVRGYPLYVYEAMMLLMLSEKYRD